MANEWEVNYPINHTLISALPEEIRTLKASTKTQLDREHATPVDGNATGGEHVNGSAVVYRGTATPTNRPDGVTALASNDTDKGRLWLDDNSSPATLKRWNGSSFDQVGTKFGTGGTVFNTSMSSGDTFQDLNLSGTVGSNVALVYLEVEAHGNANYAAKPKGQGGSFHGHNVTVGGCGFANLDANDDYAYIVCLTDSNGIIQHGSNSGSVSFTIKLLFYLK